MRRAALLAAVTVLALSAAGCMDTIIKQMGAENNPVVTVLPDTFRYQAYDMDNVHDEMQWTWVNTGTQGIVHHHSFVHHGVVQVTILDGLERNTSYDELTNLLAINCILTALAYILFPYIWRS